MAADTLTDAELHHLWRRHFAVYDDLVHGFLSAQATRRGGGDPGTAAVTLLDLESARHTLSIPRFYSSRQLGERTFRGSDPGSDNYVGQLEAELQRVRNEIDGEFA